ncbi:MAG: hypothetical protein ACOC5A_04805, partial [Halanaerobiales bacterium]
MFGLNRRQEKYLLFDRSQIQLFSLRGNRVDSEILDVESKDEEIDISRAGVEIAEASVLIPAGKLIIRIFDLPEGAQSKVDNIVNYKFVSELPFEKEEMYFTYYVDKNFSGIKIILFAVRRDYLDRIYRICSSNSIKIKGIYPLPVFNYNYYKKRVQKE